MGDMMVNRHGEVHEKTGLCGHYECTPEPKGDKEAPEFTIETSYSPPGIFKPGWRYKMTYLPEGRGQTRVIHDYGFATEPAARKAAEERATAIAKTLLPANVYKFTPRL
jgi:hypothetical protein